MRDRTTTEMVSDIWVAIDRHIEAKNWLDRATQREQVTRCELANATPELEQRVLQAPPPDTNP